MLLESTSSHTVRADIGRFRVYSRQRGLSRASALAVGPCSALSQPGRCMPSKTPSWREADQRSENYRSKGVTYLPRWTRHLYALRLRPASSVSLPPSQAQRVSHENYGVAFAAARRRRGPNNRHMLIHELDLSRQSVGRRQIEGMLGYNLGRAYFVNEDECREAFSVLLATYWTPMETGHRNGRNPLHEKLTSFRRATTSVVT